MSLVRKTVREVAGAAPRDPDLVPDDPGVFEEDDRSAALSALDGAKKTRGARTDDNHVLLHDSHYTNLALGIGVKLRSDLLPGSGAK